MHNHRASVSGSTHNLIRIYCYEMSGSRPNLLWLDFPFHVACRWKVTKSSDQMLPKPHCLETMGKKRQIWHWAGRLIGLQTQRIATKRRDALAVLQMLRPCRSHPPEFSEGAFPKRRQARHGQLVYTNILGHPEHSTGIGKQ